MTVRLEIALFGEARFRFDGEPWRFSAPPRVLPLLTYLLLHAGERVSRAQLAAILWPDDDEDAARSNLRRHLHHALKALPHIDGVAWFETDNASVGWNAAAPARIDLIEFERLIADPSTLAQAVALYGGDLLPTSYEEWILAERHRLQSSAIGGMYDLARSALARHAYGEATSWAERILAIDPWREDALRVLMSALYRSGNRSSSLAAYVRFARQLHAEMSADPMPETVALRELITADLPITHDDDLESDAAAPALLSAPHLPFVGRARPLESLRGAWMRAARRSGSTVFLTGEAGIGKSRLVAELATIVEGEGGRTLAGLTSNPENAPYQPFVDALRRGIPYLAKAPVDPLWLSAVAPLVPEILAMRPGLDPVAPIEPDAARTRLHEAFARLFEAIAKTRPLLLVLEDLHWANSDTIDALVVLARRAGGTSLLVVCTYRDESASPVAPLQGARRALQAERRAALVTLGRLDARDVAELVSHMPALADAPATLAPAAHALSEGNPLFVAQLLAGYIESGTLPDSEHGARNLAEAIAHRVDGLDAATQTVAEMAATVGREFDVDLIGEVGGWGQDAVLDALGTLMDRRLVRETGAPGFEYGFTHALIALTIYERSEAEVRVSRHRRIAQCLARENDPARLAEIARHWNRARDRDRASPAFLAAAHHAMALHARDETIACAREAAALSDDPDRRFAALTLAVAAEQMHGRLDLLESDLRDLEAAAASLSDAERFSALEARERYLASTGERDAQREVIDAMLEAAQRADSRAWNAKAQDARGVFELARGVAGEAIAPLHQALAQARGIADRALVAKVHQHLIQALVRLGDTDGAQRELDDLRASCGHDASAEERIELLWAESWFGLATENAALVAHVGAEMLALGERNGDLELQGRGRWRLGWAAVCLHDVDAGRTHYGVAAQLFERLGRSLPLATTVLNLGALELAIGHVQSALASFARAVVLGERCGSINLLGIALCTTADAQRLQGNLDAAYATAQRAHETALRTGEHRLTAMALTALGEVQCARGETHLGIALVREAVDMWRASRSNVSLIGALCVLVENLIAAGRAEEAVRFEPELSALLAQTPEQSDPGRGPFALAAIERARGNAAAARLLERRARASLEERLARYAEPDKAAYAALPFNHAIVASAHEAPRRAVSGT